ncbi:FAD-dependent oxidoreductase [Gammaproteobacteria bacterium AB-CW1]|uniref:FAD-dependent oxidoreductase n=1 Tax=Natronospira elongata TaxID=3110268 RepID=A0AAP6MKH1_9GAMM|nr:FAD-dependent oxidoreductase [Gammaproteobacteria bacterium AB-CW1]
MRIAVIGSGIAGLSCAWLLSREHEVQLYEASDRFGGHSNTVLLREGRRQIPVDTGFIVFNEPNYPHLNAFFRELGVPVHDSDMSFSASLGQGQLEYAGDGLASLFAQPANILRPSHWRMIREIVRFNRIAAEWLDSGEQTSLSLGAFLKQQGFARELSERYLLPMGAAIWSAPMARILEFPARSFLAFFRNHYLLQVADRPRWKTVLGGSREYVQRVLAELGDRAMAGVAVTAVRRRSAGVLVDDARGGQAEYDQVILACHGDQALAMLKDAQPRERDVLAAFSFQNNTAWLHSDPQLMPKRRRVWSSWNYLADREGASDRKVAVSYWMNRLQPLDASRDYFVTLNPRQRPDPALTWQRMEYEHPVFDLAAIQAQQALPNVQGTDRVWFCGAWTANGFHEDGIRSGIAVANALGTQAPWQQRHGAAVHAHPLQLAGEEA